MQHHDYPTKLEPGIDYVSTREWGQLQTPPIGLKRVQELIGERRIEGVRRPTRDYMVPRDAKRLDAREETREKWRAKAKKYKASQS